MSNSTESGSELSPSAVLATSKFVAQIETAGNQAFIFETNRLRENIGASHLLGLSCRDWVHAAAKEHKASVIFSTSGRAFLADQTREALEAVISDVTWQALVEAPGLTITGAITEWPPQSVQGSASTPLGDAMHILSDENERIAAQYPAVLNRFHRLPPVAQCAVSALPAEFKREIGSSNEFVSAPAMKKFLAGENAWKSRSKRLIEDLREFLKHQPSKAHINVTKLSFAQSIDTLEEFFSSGSGSPTQRNVDIGWLAVVHIDGSGVGKAFIEMGKHARTKAGEDSSDPDTIDVESLKNHLNAYFLLSEGLDSAAHAALIAALSEVVQKDGKIPVVPLIAGGDDVTIICLGRDALRFTSTYLRTFEAHTAEISLDLHEFLGSAGAPARFTASAGIAIVKPHYPFHLAHELAESLISSAKAGVKRTVVDGEVIPSSYDVHVLSDSSAISLDEIRERRQSRTGVRLWGGPYVVDHTSAPLVVDKAPAQSDVDHASELSPLRTHSWLENALIAATKLTDDPDKSRSSRGGLNRVKTALFESAEAAVQAEAELPAGSLPTALKDTGSDSLVTVVGNESVASSAFVDLLDLLDIHVVGTSFVESTAILEEVSQ